MKARGVESVLVTGGAGFIGSHTVDVLLAEGYGVTVLDNLEPQVHGRIKRPPGYLTKDAAFVRGTMQDRALVKKLVLNSDAVIHLAAMVGVGQSMYQVERYIDANTRGTSVLLDVLANEDHGVKRMVVASSMSIYGEGKYRCENCHVDVFPRLRPEKQLDEKRWEHMCPQCGAPMVPVATDESKPLQPTSVYAQSKRHQEEMSLLIGETYGISVVALRYFNVYGSRQALANPYTGACAIFSNRILNRKPPYIFEDGKQVRDFIHVRDVAQANLLAIESTSADQMVLNIGTGKPTSILGLANTLIQLYGFDVKPEIPGSYRKGDIRHCFADVTKAAERLGFQAKIGLEEGLSELSQWAKDQGWGAADLFDRALGELKQRGLSK